MNWMWLISFIKTKTIKRTLPKQTNLILGSEHEKEEHKVAVAERKIAANNKRLSNAKAKVSHENNNLENQKEEVLIRLNSLLALLR
jgi:hypothetical protein